MKRFLPALLFSASFCLALGLTLPLVRMERLYVFTDQPSLIEMMAGLWAENDYALSIIILLVSVLFPILKLYTLHVAAYRRDGGSGVPSWMRALSNWSMLDVVLVAIVIYAAKTSGLANAVTLPGLWFFAAAAVLTSVASSLMAKA